MPAAPASPWTSRKTSSTEIDQAKAQASEASAYATSPIISGRLPSEPVRQRPRDDLPDRQADQAGGDA